MSSAYTQDFDMWKHITGCLVHIQILESYGRNRKDLPENEKIYEHTKKAANDAEFALNIVSKKIDLLIEEYMIYS